MGDKEAVLIFCPNAFCCRELGWFQIRATDNSAQHWEFLSSQHPTEPMAWHFAALRMRVAQHAKEQCESYKHSVSQAFPRAYCAVLSGKFFQIRRPRTGVDTRGLLDHVPLSGRFSSEVFAWQDAANRLAESSEDCRVTPMASASRRVGKGPTTGKVRPAFSMTT
jgi:hypothetical protein